MEFSALQIATFLSGTVEGDPEVKVYNVAKIEEGAPGMLSFLANPKYSQYLYTTKSSIVLINNDFELQDKVSATLIRVPDAYAAFAQLLGLYQQFMQAKSGVSSLSFISKDATYGEDYTGGMLNALASLRKGSIPPTASIHRLQRRLPGYLIPFATYAFVP